MIWAKVLPRLLNGHPTGAMSTGGLPLIRALCQRLGSPKCFTELSLQVCEYHTQCHNAFSLKSGTLLRLFQKLDSFRKADRFNHFLLTCEADSKGRLGHEDVLYPQRDYLRSLANAARNVDFSPLNLSEKSIEERIELINRARLKAIQMEKQRLHSRMV